MGKRLIELNTCREDKNCEKAPEHAREDFTDWQIDWNFPKPQSFLLLLFFKKDLVSRVNILVCTFFLLLLKRLMHPLNSFIHWVLSKFRFKYLTLNHS